ncbi:MAG: nucleotidyltransferase family protein, partial [Lachnospiraceae bacterium]|nr:nucleotidyltransferase family protein [Lachnospiraceae bacterium]
MADKPMTKEEYRSAMDDAIWLCACTVKGEIPDRERIGGMDLTLLYRASKHHLLTAMVAYVLESAGVKEPAFSQAKAKAIRKLGLMDAEMSVLLERMEQAGIWYMPLKGTVLKDHYPAYGLRQMADHDILFDAERAEDVRDILTDMGFTADHFGAGNHDCYYKEPVCNFE